MNQIQLLLNRIPSPSLIQQWIPIPSLSICIGVKETSLQIYSLEFYSSFFHFIPQFEIPLYQSLSNVSPIQIVNEETLLVAVVTQNCFVFTLEIQIAQQKWNIPSHHILPSFSNSPRKQFNYKLLCNEKMTIFFSLESDTFCWMEQDQFFQFSIPNFVGIIWDVQLFSDTSFVMLTTHATLGQYLYYCTYEGLHNWKVSSLSLSLPLNTNSLEEISYIRFIIPNATTHSCLLLDSSTCYKLLITDSQLQLQQESFSFFENDSILSFYFFKNFLYLSTEQNQLYVYSLETEKPVLETVYQFSYPMDQITGLYFDEELQVQFLSCTSLQHSHQIILQYSNGHFESISTCHGIYPCKQVFATTDKNNFLIHSTAQQVFFFQQGYKLYKEFQTETENEYMGLISIFNLSQQFVILSFYHETRVLEMDLNTKQFKEDSSLEHCFVTNESTLFCYKLWDQFIIQITTHSILAIDLDTKLVYNFQMTDSILHAHAYEQLVVICTNQQEWMVFQFTNQTWKLFSKCNAKQETSCIYCYSDHLIYIATYANIVIVNAQLQQLDEILFLKKETEEQVIVHTMIRSNDVLYIGLRDGKLLCYHCMTKQFLSSFFLGNKPVQLIPYLSQDKFIALSNQLYFFNVDQLYPMFTSDITCQVVQYFDEHEILICDSNFKLCMMQWNSHSLQPLIHPLCQSICKMICIKEWNQWIGFDSKQNCYGFNLITKQTISIPLSTSSSITSSTITSIEYKYIHPTLVYLLLGTQQGNLYWCSLQQIVNPTTQFIMEILSCISLLPSIPISCIQYYEELYILVAQGKRIVMIQSNNNTNSKELKIMAQNVTRNVIHSVHCVNQKICVSDQYDGIIVFVFLPEKQCLEYHYSSSHTSSHTSAKSYFLDMESVLCMDRNGILSVYEKEEELQCKAMIKWNEIGITLLWNNEETVLEYPLGNRTQFIMEQQLLLAKSHNKRYEMMLYTLSGARYRLSDLSNHEYMMLTQLENIMQEELQMKWKINGEQIIMGEFIRSEWNRSEEQVKEKWIQQLNQQLVEWNVQVSRETMEELFRELKL